ncbi:hypothetical protein ACFXNW_00260 [Nocardia sp. NPDC059180]|uniref:hypothetical protein n=1 Tax=Nocardia sp. NPDC059180 TaxID=3346761 RepID=UPI0036BCB242
MREGPIAVGAPASRGVATGPVRLVHSADDFDTPWPLNARLVRACTDWQVTIHPDGSMQDNDHADIQRDRRTLSELKRLAEELVPLTSRLTERLARFSGYHTRFAAALSLAADNPDMVTGTEHDSAHRVWFELHEDLIATLGIDRAALPSSP